MYFTKQTTDSEGSHNNFIPVEAWQTTAEIVAPLLSKGLEVIVNGTIIQKRWIDDNGSMKSQFVFSADAINITDLKFSINEDIQTEAA
jgi:single-stranded DNA-binding protein